MADNDYIFAVNEAVNNKMMYCAGVLTEASAPESEGDPVIQFPKGEYLVVKREANTAEELGNQLTGIAFGQVLSAAKNFPMSAGRTQRLRWGAERVRFWWSADSFR